MRGEQLEGDSLLQKRQTSQPQIQAKSIVVCGVPLHVMRPWKFPRTKWSRSFSFVADHHQLHFTTNGLKALRYCEVRIPSLRSTSPPPSQKKSSSNLVIASSMITCGAFCIKQLANFIVSLTRLTFRASLHKNLPKASNWQNFIQSAKANFISLVLVIG